jgi:hypothetical protein
MATDAAPEGIDEPRLGDDRAHRDHAGEDAIAEAGHGVLTEDLARALVAGEDDVRRERGEGDRSPVAPDHDGLSLRTGPLVA